MLASQLNEYGLPAMHRFQEPLFASPEHEEILIRNEVIVLNFFAPLMVQGRVSEAAGTARYCLANTQQP